MGGGRPHRGYQPWRSSSSLLQLCSSALHWTPDTADTSQTTTASCTAVIGPNWYQVQFSLLGSLVYQAVEQGVSPRPRAAHGAGVRPAGDELGSVVYNEVAGISVRPINISFICLFFTLLTTIPHQSTWILLDVTKGFHHWFDLHWLVVFKTACYNVIPT